MPRFWIELAAKMEQDPNAPRYHMVNYYVNPLWGLISVIIVETLHTFRLKDDDVEILPDRYNVPILEYRFVKDSRYLTIKHYGRWEWDITLRGPKKAQKMITGSNDVNKTYWRSSDFKAQNIYRLFRTGWKFVWIREQGEPHYISSQCIVCTAPAAGVCSHCNEATYCGEECQEIDWDIHNKNGK
jgi:hypothetical protein